jgi:hypothetical protein
MIADLIAALPGVDFITDPALVRQKSRDFFWYSPVLKRQLNGATAEAVAMPRDEAEVVAIMRECFARGIAVTPRGAGTGNYGQAMPLKGGVVLDPFLGSGTTAVAAIEEGVEWIGCEREPEYVEIIKARVAAAQPGMGLTLDKGQD